MADFRFRQFAIRQEGAAHRVGTDGVLLGAWAPAGRSGHLLDIGAGTGLISLMLAQRNPDACIDAVEPHPASLECARYNFQQSPWSGRLQVYPSRFQDFIQHFPDKKYQLIVSNPPYFTEHTASPDPARRAARQVDALPFNELLQGMGQCLAPEGFCCLVLPQPAAWQFLEMAVPQGLYPNRLTEIISRPGKPVERVLLQLSRRPLPYLQEKHVIYDENGAYSAWFRALTAGFYLDI